MAYVIETIILQLLIEKKRQKPTLTGGNTGQSSDWSPSFGFVSFRKGKSTH